MLTFPLHFQTVSAFYSFFLAMALHPEVQKKAQEEIDRVGGPDRLPTFDDQPDLPYVDALLKEILRWNPVAPLGLPHVTTSDDTFEGYYIPKGSMLIANIWYALSLHKFASARVLKPLSFFQAIYS